MRCYDCKKERNDNLPLFDRFKGWMLKFFLDEIVDAKAEAFTRGMGDGYRKGFETCKELQQEKLALLESREPIKLDYQVSLTSVLDIVSGSEGFSLYIGGEKLTEAEIEVLKQEADSLQRSRLWSIIQETVKQQAIKKAVLDSKNWEEALAGKMMLHDLGILRSIVEAIQRYQLKGSSQSKN